MDYLPVSAMMPCWSAALRADSVDVSQNPSSYDSTRMVIEEVESLKSSTVDSLRMDVSDECLEAMEKTINGMVRLLRSPVSWRHYH
jgi:hypothetical protein